MKSDCSNNVDASCQEASTPKVPTSKIYTNGYFAGQKALAEKLEFALQGLWKAFKGLETRRVISLLLVEFVNPYLD